MARPPLKRVGPRLGGVALDGAIPFVTSAGVRPLTEAILYRVFKDVERSIDDESFSAAGRLINHAYLLEEFMLPGQPMETMEWLLSMSSSRRRKALIKAYHDLNARGSFHVKFDKIAAFVKTELLPYFAQTDDGPNVDLKTYVARLIQAPHDETHIVAGPWLKPLVARLKSIWHHDNWLFYASVSPDKLDKWVRRLSDSVSWYWSDYSAFDATYSKQAWELIEGMYRRIYPDAPEEFWKVLDIWRTPSGDIRLRKEDVKVKYQAAVCNASGRDDTALANALLNGIVLSLSFAAALARKRVADVTEEDLSVAAGLVDIAVVGDDSLVACKFDVSNYTADIQRNIESFGLSVKAEHSHELADVTFLGMMPYPVAGTLCWGPTIGRRLYKAFWQADPIGNLPAWTKGVAEQLLQYANVPILYDLAKRVVELLPRTPSTKVQRDENRVWQSINHQNPLWDRMTVDWLCLRLRSKGVTPQMVYRDIERIQRIERLPAVVWLEVPLLASCFEDL